jgi:hypothetical protein
MLIFRSSLLILALLVPVFAAETPAPAPATGAAKAAEPAKSPSVGSVPDEEKWTFEPAAGRLDVFNDLEERIKIETDLSNTPSGETVGPAVIAPSGKEKVDAAIEWGAKEAERVESLILVRKWDETIQACDNAIKNLEKYQANTPVAELMERFKRYRTQADEAKIYEEAQAKFDALGLKIEGILWSPEGSLAVIGGEPRALKINDRAKDCVIINIDTNRVDFLFHYNRRRFEFQRYVGEVGNASRAH